MCCRFILYSGEHSYESSLRKISSITFWWVFLVLSVTKGERKFVETYLMS